MFNRAISIFLAWLLATQAAFAGSPAIFNGTRTKLLTQKGVTLQSGATLDYDGLTNYIGNNEGEVDTSGWVAYKNAGAIPTTGEGGTPDTSMISIDNTTLSNVLSKTRSIRFFKSSTTPGDAQGNGYSYDFTISKGDRNKLLSLNFLYATDGSSSPASGDFVVYLYDRDAGALVTPSQTSIPLTTSSIQEFNATFLTNATSLNYRLIFHLATTATSGRNMLFDRVYVGPGTVRPVVPIGPITPTITWNGSAGLTFDDSTIDFYRVGEYLHIGGHLFVAGSGTSSSSFTFSLAGITPVNLLGGGHFRVEEAVGSERHTFFIYGSGGIFTFFPENTGTSTSIIGTNVGDTGTDYERFYFDAFIKIQEWVGSQSYAGQNSVEYAYNTSTSTTTSDTTSFAYGEGGAPIQVITAGLTRRVQFQSEIQPGDDIDIQISSDRLSWISVKGLVNFPGVLAVKAYDLQNSVSYGIGYRGISGGSRTQLDVVFGTYSQSSGATFGANGSSWANGASVYWRVKKTKAGEASGFGLATSAGPGLVDPYNQGSGVVYSGTYTPTFTAVSNVASASASVDWNYTRIGNVVIVSGAVTVDPTATSTATSVGISLPVPSAVQAAEVSGNASSGSAATFSISPTVNADASNARATLYFNCTSDNSAKGYNVNFIYLIH